MYIPDVEFRPAETADMGELALVLARANAARDDQPLPELADHESYQDVLARVHRIDAWTHVAIRDDRIAGFALSHPLKDPENVDAPTDTEHLALLMLDPDYWGRRIASQLIDLTAAHARATDKQRLTLWTREANNTRARQVYTHKGFSLTGVRRPTDDGMSVQYQLEL